ncbi:MAG: hypothetical protein IGS49_17145 [Chlorogloeopsis fritschii C42_A2020_084]|jgi:hypothetical protein|uniref:hypothetical protein n=1 Tax=Chlorogloeopsis fritschii TaxID=1124 RepID=UPI0019DB3B08|nr:hypothetical protein [Chlorogloeopsis fritschii]MBF2007140.1 hypothetical protein [Chlorogloeopsis fritschii C42_A2020_084]
MHLFLVACVDDEGIYDSSFRVIEATSRLAVAKDMLQNPQRWKSYLQSAYDEECKIFIWDYIHQNPDLIPELLLQKIDNTDLDGDSFSQLRIFEIQTVEKVD